MNNTVVGPISLEDWRTMRSILRSINYYKQRNEEKFAYALETETRLYKGLRDKYIPANDNVQRKEAA